MTRTAPDAASPDSRGFPAAGGGVAAAGGGVAGAGGGVAAPTEPAWVPLLVLDQLLFPGQAKFTTEQLVASVGVEREIAVRLWRAMGFTPAADDDPVFVEDDLSALQMATGALTQFSSLEEIVYQTRVMAAALSRVAEVVSDTMVANLHAMALEGMTEEDMVECLSLPDPREVDRLIGYVYRRQLRAALWRKLADPDQVGRPTTLAVGFVDLVRFTAVTEDIAEEQLGELIDRFETIVYDRVTDSGGRVVKMIGDEVMFVAEEGEQATSIAVDLVRSFDEEDSVPTARAGLAFGAVLSHGGDFFGPVVNLAARIVDVARPSTVVVSQEIHDDLAGHAGFSWRRLPPKRLKGIGRPSLYAVSRSGGG